MPTKKGKRKFKMPNSTTEAPSDADNAYEKDIASVTGGISLNKMEELDITPACNDTDDSSMEESSPAEEVQGQCKDGIAKSRENFMLLRKHQQAHEGVDLFRKVSDEIILHIFYYLPKIYLIRCASVCKRWKDISYDESLWRKYDFGRRVVKPGVLETVFGRKVNVLRLAMSEIKYPVFSPAFLQNPEFSAVQYLDLSMVTTRADGLADILFVCVHLKKLSLENCVLNDSCLKNIAQNKDLTVLNMAMCSGLTADGLSAICIQCDKLREWNLAWTDASRSTMSSFLPYMPVSLKRLNISGYREVLYDEDFVKMVQRCVNLTELDISDCLLLGVNSFEAILENCRKLEHLHSSRVYEIPTACNRRLTELPNFTHLDIFRTLTDDAFNSLQRDMPRVHFNQNVFSCIARPTTGIRRTSIWGLSTRD